MNPSILLVDDEPDTFDLFRQRFRREIRMNVVTLDFAPSAEHALDHLDRDDPPDVRIVLLDINMPGMSGLDLLPEIKRRWPWLVVFMVTAYGDAATQRKAQYLGADDFFSKPVDFTTLKQRVSVRFEERSGA
jgi:DNA-binding NtrC family response regulator